MKKSRFCALGLACFLGAVTTFSALAGTLGGGGVFSHETRINTDNSGGQRLSAEEEKIAAEMQEQLLNGTLELDPEKDPVIFTTDYGLEIKSHNVGEVNASLKGTNGSTSVNNISWNYISAGGYKWIIIGSYSSSSYTMSTLSGAFYSKFNLDNTDAGYAIDNAGDKSVLKINTLTIPAFTNAAGNNNEIPIGCVLCLCETYVDTKRFYASYGTNNYAVSELKSYIDNTVYGTTSEIGKALRALPLVPRTLTTYYQNGGVSTINNAYVFLLAGQNENESYHYAKYLNSEEKCAGFRWWLRSGCASNNAPLAINITGSISNYGYDGMAGSCVRPAFVLRLYSA